MNNRLRSLALASFAFVQLGCVVIPGPRGRVHHGPPPPARPVYVDESCPPGHRWSDGQCHDRGRGHDPEHHKGHGHGHHDDD